MLLIMLIDGGVDGTPPDAGNMHTCDITMIMFVGKRSYMDMYKSLKELSLHRKNIGQGPRPPPRPGNMHE